MEKGVDIDYVGRVIDIVRRFKASSVGVFFRQQILDGKFSQDRAEVFYEDLSGILEAEFGEREYGLGNI